MYIQNNTLKELYQKKADHCCLKSFLKHLDNKNDDIEDDDDEDIDEDIVLEEETRSVVPTTEELERDEAIENLKQEKTNSTKEIVAEEAARKNGSDKKLQVSNHLVSALIVLFIIKND